MEATEQSPIDDASRRADTSTTTTTTTTTSGFVIPSLVVSFVDVNRVRRRSISAEPGEGDSAAAVDDDDDGSDSSGYNDSESDEGVPEIPDDDDDDDGAQDDSTSSDVQLNYRINKRASIHARFIAHESSDDEDDDDSDSSDEDDVAGDEADLDELLTQQIAAIMERTPTTSTSTSTSTNLDSSLVTTTAGSGSVLQSIDSTTTTTPHRDGIESAVEPLNSRSSEQGSDYSSTSDDVDEGAHGAAGARTSSWLSDSDLLLDPVVSARVSMLLATPPQHDAPPPPPVGSSPRDGADEAATTTSSAGGLSSSPVSKTEMSISPHEPAPSMTSTKVIRRPTRRSRRLAAAALRANRLASADSVLGGSTASPIDSTDSATSMTAGTAAASGDGGDGDDDNGDGGASRSSSESLRVQASGADAKQKPVTTGSVSVAHADSLPTAQSEPSARVSVMLSPSSSSDSSSTHRHSVARSSTKSAPSAQMLAKMLPEQLGKQQSEATLAVPPFMRSGTVSQKSATVSHKRRHHHHGSRTKLHSQQGSRRSALDHDDDINLPVTRAASYHPPEDSVEDVIEHNRLDAQRVGGSTATVRFNPTMCGVLIGGRSDQWCLPAVCGVSDSKCAAANLVGAELRQQADQDRATDADGRVGDNARGWTVALGALSSRGASRPRDPRAARDRAVLRQWPAQHGVRTCSCWLELESRASSH